MTIANNIAESYRYWRARGLTATVSLFRAYRDAESGTRRYPKGVAINPPGEDGMRWVERPADVGLRFVGWCDEIARIGHRGWFLNDDGDGDVARGCVFQLPGRNGEARFLAAYAMGSEGRNGWQDSSGVEGSACVAFGEVFHGPTCGEDRATDHESAIDAANRADRLADILADGERDYQAAWRKGREAIDAIEAAAGERESARELLAEIRGERAPGKPATCAAIRSTIARHLESAREHYSEAMALFDNYGHESAFVDAAGSASYWEARK